MVFRRGEEVLAGLWGAHNNVVVVVVVATTENSSRTTMQNRDHTPIMCDGKMQKLKKPQVVHKTGTPKKNYNSTSSPYFSMSN